MEASSTLSWDRVRRAGATLTTPLHPDDYLRFLGSRVELDRMAFHFPASHLECAEALLAAYAAVEEPLLGQETAPADWVLVTTASFEFVRASKEDLDRRPVFGPNGLLSTTPPR